MAKENDLFTRTQKEILGHDGAKFDINILKECTVQDFIHMIVEAYPDEYGTIEFEETEGYTAKRDRNIKIEYKRGTLLPESVDPYWMHVFTTTILRFPVIEVSAFGGYTNMDYKIKMDWRIKNEMV